MATVIIHQAKTQLSKLIARAGAGEKIVIARGKEPVVKLEALQRPTAAGRLALGDRPMTAPAGAADSYRKTYAHQRVA